MLIKYGYYIDLIDGKKTKVSFTKKITNTVSTKTQKIKIYDGDFIELDDYTRTIDFIIDGKTYEVKQITTHTLKKVRKGQPYKTSDVFTYKGHTMPENDKKMIEFILNFDKLNERDNFSGGGAYPGPSVVGPDNAWAGGTIGSGAEPGETGAMGSGYPKKDSPATPAPNKFKPTINRTISKDSLERKSAIKRLQKLDTQKLKNFIEYHKKDENEEKETE